MTPVSEVGIGLTRLIWHTDLGSLPAWKRRLANGARLIHAVVRDLVSGQLSLYAMSLVYTTLLSLVPLLAVSFSVLKGFGVHNQIQPMLLQALAPLGDKSNEIAGQLIAYVDNTNVGVLGSVGLAFLLYSVISLVSKIEQAFNYTWHVARPRPLAQRVSQYMSVLLIGPVLFFSAVGATASLRSYTVVQRLEEIAPLGLLFDLGARLIPYFLIVLAFSFAYMFLPNTRVKLRAALVGALVAGLLWQGIGYVFAHFMAGSTRYAAIYSGLAILILFMIWIYIAWLILLIGASIAFYDQYPEYLATRTRELRLSNRLRERVTLTIAAEIAARHESGDALWTSQALGHALSLPSANVRTCLEILCRDGFLVPTAEDPARYLPARAPSSIAVTELLASIRRYGEEPQQAPAASWNASIVALQEDLERASEQMLAGMSLADLGRALDSEQAPAPASKSGLAAEHPGKP